MQRRYEPQYNIKLKHKTNPHHADFDPAFVPPHIPEPPYKKYPQPVYRHAEPEGAPSPNGMDDRMAPSPEPLYKMYAQPYYPPLDKPPCYGLQPTNTLYGYADPRHIPPAGASPEPQYKQYQQPKYNPGDRRSPEREFKQARPREEHRPQKADLFSQKKFDYQLDGRFHQVPDSHDNYDRSPRHDHHQGFDRSPRHDHHQGFDRSPRHGYHHQHYDTTPTNTYQTEINRHIEPIHEQKRAEVNKGYLVMMRFLSIDLTEVITAIQQNIGIIDSHNGYVIGFADPKHMAILVTNNDMLIHDQWWDPRFNSRYGVCCFWFKDVYSARRWFESGKRFNQPDFPNSHPYEVVAVPLTYGRNSEPAPFSPSAQPVTLLWCEFPNIFERYHNDFLENYSEPTRRIMKAYGGHPHISVSKFKAGWPEEPNKFGQPGYARYNIIHERYARAIKRGWTKPETFISVSAFPSMNAVVDFYKDPHYQDIRSKLDNYSSPVFVAMTLTPVVGTTKYR